MKKLIFVILLLSSPSFATTRYIGPAGTNAGGCTTSGSPCLTWAYLMTQMVAGDTLMVKDGTYTPGTHGQLLISSKTCNAAQPCTIQAENERQAWIQGTGSDYAVNMNGSTAYWTLHGLRISSGNFAGAGHGAVIEVDAANNTFRKLLVHKNNVHVNSNLIVINGSNNLIEECEFYDYHRIAVNVYGGTGNVVRRNYAANRGYVGGTTPLYTALRQDFLSYPASNTIFENNISEGSQEAYLAQSAGGTRSSNNKFYGNMEIGSTSVGFAVGAAGTNPLAGNDNLFLNNVSVGATGVAFKAGTSRGTRFDNNTAIGCTGDCTAAGVSIYGFLFDRTDTFDSASLTGYSDNSLSYKSIRGFFVDTTDFGTWLIDYPNANSNATFNYSPSSHANLTHSGTTDPSLGSCKVWIPDASPMKGAGKGGVDKGANILYEYVGGVLTSTPLWNTSGPNINNFVGCGVEVAGVNDSGTRCTTVDVRLNVGTANGCAFPSGYGGSPTGGGTWLATDNFDSDASTDLNGHSGGSGWTGNWTQSVAAMTVDDAPAGGQGGKAIKITADPDALYTRAFSSLTKGVMGYQFWISSATPGGDTKVAIAEGGTGRCYTNIASDGNVKLFDGTTYFSIGTYTAQTWTPVTVEFDDTAQPDKCRAKLGSGNFSSWVLVNGSSYSGMDNVRILSGAGLTATVYIDDFKEGTTQTVISTISYIGPGGSSRWYVGETKNLTWVSTGITNVKVEISRDLGVTYSTIVASTAASAGTYAWVVEAPAQFSPANQVLIRISDASNASVFSLSDPVDIYGSYLKIR